MRRTPLKRKTPLRQRSVKPRRPRKRSGAAEKRHLARVAAMPCIVCRKPGPSTVHHVRRRPHIPVLHARVHCRTVPLCPQHHLHDWGPESVERLKEGGFLDKFGIDLWVEAERLWRESEELERGA